MRSLKIFGIVGAILLTTLTLTLGTFSKPLGTMPTVRLALQDTPVKQVAVSVIFVRDGTTRMAITEIFFHKEATEEPFRHRRTDFDIPVKDQLAIAEALNKDLRAAIEPRVQRLLRDDQVERGRRNYGLPNFFGRELRRAGSLLNG